MLNTAALLWLGRIVERRLGPLRLTAIFAASLRLPLTVCFAAVIATSLLPGVSLAGHLGGLLGGFLIAKAMHSRTRAAFW